MMDLLEFTLGVIIASGVIVGLLIRFAPLGYEDERGFHAGTPPGDDPYTRYYDGFLRPGEASGESLYRRDEG